jgi:transcriptional regulator with XRE-family HTH domain
MHIGVKIKMARIARGIKQDELAEMISKTRPLVSYVEQTGKVSPRTLVKICKALKIDQQQLENIASEGAVDYNTVKEREQQMQREIDSLKERVRVLDELVKAQKDIIEVLRNKNNEATKNSRKKK